MDNISKNVINELQKLFLKKKTVVFLILMAVISFLPAFFVSAIQARIVFISLSSVSFPLITLSAAANFLLPLFIFMAASEVFPGEAADRTMKLVLIRPITRFKVYISKNIAVGIYAIINILVVFIVSTISFIALKLSAENIPRIFLSYFIDIFPILIFTIFACLIVQFFRSSSAALISGIFIFAAIKVLAILISGFNNIIFTSYLNWYPAWMAGTSLLLRNMNTLVMLTAYGVIFFTVGYYIFDRKEF